MAAGIFLGAVFLVIGLIPAVPQNRFYGVRTPWTRRSEYSWQGANRLARPLFFAAGVLTIGITLLAPDAGIWAGAGLAVAAAVVLTVYSWWLASNEPGG